MKVRALLLPLLAAALASGAEPPFVRPRRPVGPEQRRRRDAERRRLDKRQRFAEALPVLVATPEGVTSLADLFTGLLEPALETTTYRAGTEPALREIHARALAAFEGLRRAYAPPHPVRAGTLDLMLAYGFEALQASALDPAARLRFFTEAMRIARTFDGRVEPDARTAWLVRYRLLPALLGLAERAEAGGRDRAAITEAASLLYMPAVLDRRAQAALAPLTSGAVSRSVLKRFYRQGILDARGRTALARSVRMQVRDDPAFAAGAAPLMLRLLTDPLLDPRERGALIDVILGRLAGMKLMASTARDLLAAGLGGPPGGIASYRARREKHPGPVLPPKGKRTFRFLSVVLLQERPGRPPFVARVVRRDVGLYTPLFVRDPGGGRRFVGVLLPDKSGGHADFVGPPPGLGRSLDHRLLRRELRLERIAVRRYGAKDDEIELSATLPEDASEPMVPGTADLSRLIAWIEARLEISQDREERLDLIRLLAGFGTDGALALAVRSAKSGAELHLLVAPAERGYRPAQERLLARLAPLAAEDKERVLAAALTSGRKQFAPAVLAICRQADVESAALAADALLVAGDTRGIPLLLDHPNPFARACAVTLALRLSPLAGGLRVTPQPAPDPKTLAGRIANAFPARLGRIWSRFGAWAALAIKDPKRARKLRLEHPTLYLGPRRVRPFQFAAAYAAGFSKGKEVARMPQMVVFLLDPADPGRGILLRDLDPLLDVLETRALAPGSSLRRTWIECLALLEAAHSGLDLDPGYAELAARRLAKAAGKTPPPGVHRKPGLYWLIWAARQ